MRHLATLVAAVVIAPLAWLMAAYGEDRSVQAFANAETGSLHSGAFVRPMIMLAAAGFLLGLIATLRLSPVGALLAGLAYLASYLALLVDPDGVLDLLPDKLSIAGKQVDPATPLRSGTTMLLGALLLVAVFAVWRWKRREADLVAVGPGATTSWANDRPLGVDGLGLSQRARAVERPAAAGRPSLPGPAGPPSLPGPIGRPSLPGPIGRPSHRNTAGPPISRPLPATADGRSAATTGPSGARTPAGAPTADSARHACLSHSPQGL